ncbi:MULTISPECIES: hypothetical protein [unclassified Nodularia (in: cyanobacteria)]|nr:MULTISPECIES: hypothetical protein [unclassified Nodularia (in: cyanobacteria)]MBE9201209.1 hypothetical protein [Nodularia sp. LEGE 06071]MCC2695199.1 hypothetical protein [Nodularia sp. LEGE 04288]
MVISTPNAVQAIAKGNIQRKSCSKGRFYRNSGLIAQWIPEARKLM